MNFINSLTQMEAAGVGLILGALMIWIIALAIAYEILLIVSYWKLFNKAGEKGWKAIIPIYNDYVRYKLTWKPAIFWILLVLSVVSSVIANYLKDSNGMTAAILMLIAFICTIAFIVISIIGEVKLAKSYGKGGGFAVVLILTGLIALDWIPMLVLAFGKSKYVGSWKPKEK